MRVLVLVDTYLPGYKAGGPIRSIANLVEAFSGKISFRIVTRDRDLGEKLPFAGIVANRWVRVGSADVMYLRPGFPGLLGMCALLRSVHPNTVLYLNGFFPRRFSMLPVLMRWLNLCRPRCLLIAPRSEFSLGALRLKRRRKLLYIRIARWFGLYNGVFWQASSGFEAGDIRRQFHEARQIDVAAAVADVHAFDGKSRTSGVGSGAGYRARKCRARRASY